MSSARLKVKDRVLAKVVGDAIKSKFGELSPNCPDRIVDSGGKTVCCYHSDSASDCRFGICPKMALPLDEAAEILEGEEPKRR